MASCLQVLANFWRVVVEFWLFSVVFFASFWRVWRILVRFGEFEPVYGKCEFLASLCASLILARFASFSKSCQVFLRVFGDFLANYWRVLASFWPDLASFLRVLDEFLVRS